MSETNDDEAMWYWFTGVLLLTVFALITLVAWAVWQNPVESVALIGGMVAILVVPYFVGRGADWVVFDE